MKKLLLGLLLSLPLLANANASPLSQVSSAHLANNPISTTIESIQVSESTIANLGAINYLKSFTAEFTHAGNQQNNKVAIKNTSNEVPVPAALPLLITAVGLFSLGANRRRV
jgi:hypothetical protein